MIVIVPSRGRPKRAVNMVQSVHDTASTPVRVVVAVDPDEPHLAEYRRKVRDLVVLQERIGYSGTINLIAAENWDEHDILGAFGDDVLFRTKGWDNRVRETLTVPGLAFPNDLAHRQNWPTAVFMSSVIAKALGYLALPACRHQYVDNAWKRFGDDLGILRYMDDVICEHMHEAYGKAPNDATYREVYSEPQATIDNLAFHRWVDDGRLADEARIMAVFDA